MCSLCNLVRTREDLAQNVHLLDRYSDFSYEGEVELDPGRYNLLNQVVGQQAASRVDTTTKRSEEEQK